MHACILEHSGTFWNFNSMHACMHAFWNILELSGTLTPCMHACMHSGTFCMHYGTFCMHSGTFWNFCMHAFWNILELLHACILEHSACMMEHFACILEHS